ncbi:MAG: sulfite exporter TauE/SafE family protein [Planctomycetales bacterium]|nr:sulfite exporter TauE/SafE family protein [Planctomycetales bacterium]MBN8625428.1 sulfite exporter TauE/SafE family protein [Planctomycetota bacterium]
MNLITSLCGAVVGLSLGLTGGGGAIFAVPLLVYVIGIDAREAIGVSLATVGATALVGCVQRARLGAVEFRTGLLFALAGMLTAPLGARLATYLSEGLLLSLFAGVMLIVALRMWGTAASSAERLPAPADGESGPTCRRDPQGVLRLTSRCALLLLSIGMISGVLTGLFGVGGGFIIVPALVLFSGMGIQRAVGTSLLVITLVSFSGVTSLVVSERTIPWSVVRQFSLGSLIGLVIGSRLAARLGGSRLQRVFAIAIVLVAAFVIARNLVF